MKARCGGIQDLDGWTGGVSVTFLPCAGVLLALASAVRFLCRAFSGIPFTLSFLIRAVCGHRGAMQPYFHVLLLLRSPLATAAGVWIWANFPNYRPSADFENVCYAFCAAYLGMFCSGDDSMVALYPALRFFLPPSLQHYCLPACFKRCSLPLLTLLIPYLLLHALRISI